MLESRVHLTVFGHSSELSKNRFFGMSLPRRHSTFLLWSSNIFLGAVFPKRRNVPIQINMEDMYFSIHCVLQLCYHILY
jgi:hypothetical protein